MSVSPPLSWEEVQARRRRLAFGVLGLAALFLLPQVGPFRGNSATFTLGMALCSGMVGLSINVLTGYAGQISLGHAALFGTGAFATAHLTTLRGLPFWLALPLGALLTGAVVLVVGFPALRIRGLHLAIVTLGFQFVMHRIVFRLQPLTGGSAGIEIRRPEFLGQSLEGHRQFIYVIILAVLFLFWLDRNLTRTRAGRAFFAIREDEQVAASFGIDVARYKLLAFVLSGCYAGLAGGLFGGLITFVTVETFDYQPSLEFLAYAVIGGLGSRLGTMIGAMIPIFFQQIFQSLRSWGVVLGGVLLVLTLVRYRGGLADQGRELRHLGHLLWTHRRAIAVALVRLVLNLPRLALRFVRAVPGRAVAFVRGVPRLPSILAARKERRRRKPPPKAPPAEAQVASFGIADSGFEASRNGRIDLRRRTSAPVRRRPGHLLEVTEVAIRFGGVQALGGVSLEVCEGEIVGIMGPNGAGKTTMFNCITGFAKPQEGRVSFRGLEISDLPPHARAALGIGRTFQNIGLVKSETVRSNFLIAQHTVAPYGPLEGLLRTGAVQVHERELIERAEHVTSMLGLSDVLDSKVHDLPHGLLKMVELGCALVTGPEVLLLDEPSSGMSPVESDRLGEVLEHIRDTFGVTILMIEHHVPLVLAVADYVYVLNFGTLLAEGEGSEIASHPEVVAAYLGESDVEDLEEELEAQPG